MWYNLYLTLTSQDLIPDDLLTPKTKLNAVIRPKIILDTAL
jgi:hypothetical protein